MNRAENSVLRVLSPGPMMLKELKVWSNAAGQPTSDASQRTLAGTDSTCTGRSIANRMGASQPGPASAIDAATPAATVSPNHNADTAAFGTEVPDRTCRIRNAGRSTPG